MAVDVPALLDLLVRYGYVLVFLAGLAEGIPLVGVFFPGQAVILVAGALAAGGRLSVWWVVAAAIPAGIFGDAIGYYIGRHYGRPFLERYGHIAGLNEKRLARSDALFAKYGAFALVFGRFSFLTRGLVALLAGSSKMRLRVFWPVNIVGGIAWALGFTLTGYLFGYSFLYVEGRVGRVLAYTLLTVVGIYVLYRVLRRYAPQFTREDLAVALLAVASGSMFGVLADRVVAVGGANRFDAWHGAYVEALAPFAPLLDVFARVTGITVLGALALALLGWLAYKRRAWEAGLVGIAVGGALLLVAVLRPLLQAPDGHVGFPSDRAAVVLAFAGAVTYIVAAHSPTSRRTIATATGLAVVSTLAGHALLATVERPTDALGGLVLGASWLCLSILLVEFGLKRQASSV